MSDQTHFSGHKAVRVAGMRTHRIKAKKLENGNYGIDATDVEQAMSIDRTQGLVPCVVFLNYGSTNTCGYDDLHSFKRISNRSDFWLHVDAAYAGASLILPNLKPTPYAFSRFRTLSISTARNGFFAVLTQRFYSLKIGMISRTHFRQAVTI